MTDPLTHLARKAADGDRDAFADLLAQIYDRLFAFAFRMTGNAHEAEDLVQDICATLPAKLRNFRAESQLTTWLYRIAVNAARDRHRRATSQARAADAWGDLEKMRREDATEHSERKAWLHMAMNALTPPELRETVLLMLEGLSHAEIGAVQGVSEGTVSWRLSQARRKLKAMRQAA